VAKRGDAWLSGVMGGYVGRWVAISQEGRWVAKWGDGWLIRAMGG
jgi:hypothetical protein